MSVIINPGTGPVWGAGTVRQRHADRNMRALCRDAGCGTDCRVVRDGEVDRDGRYPYKIVRRRRFVSVDMPGLKLERVRILEEDGQNAWDFPRLYIDGSSWLWCFALGFVRMGLGLPKVATP